MTDNITAKALDTIEQLLEKLESIIADYPEELRKNYAQCKKSCEWWDEGHDSEKSEIKGISAHNLALIHRLMFASAFAASCSSLPDRNVPETGIDSTAILDAVTEAGIPTRDFLRDYGSYGNQFTWKLLKLTGRIREGSDQPVPNLA